MDFKKPFFYGEQLETVLLTLKRRSLIKRPVVDEAHQMFLVVSYSQCKTGLQRVRDSVPKVQMILSSATIPILFQDDVQFPHRCNNRNTTVLRRQLCRDNISLFVASLANATDALLIPKFLSKIAAFLYSKCIISGIHIITVLSREHFEKACFALSYCAGLKDSCQVE